VIKKAVIPAAGFGTRFLPATKSQPKEMLPVVDKPVIQYVVEEAVESEMTDILMIIGKGKRAIEEHFDRNFELERELETKRKFEELADIRGISALADVHFVWQKELNGLGDAISCARHHVGREPFAVLLGDCVLRSHSPVVGQLAKVYEQHRAPVVILEEVDRSRVSRYGVIDGEEVADGVYKIRDFVEKPAPDEAPSMLAIAGRYVLTPDIFDYLDKTEPGKNDEIQLTDAMRLMVQEQDMYGLRLDGRRHDVGNKLDFIKANIELGLERADFGNELGEFLEFVTRRRSGDAGG